MEQFVGTVGAGAETRTFRDVDSQDATTTGTPPEPAADYIGPRVAKSDYLDRAVNPSNVAGSKANCRPNESCRSSGPTTLSAPDGLRAS
jgi:hypothetical protein